MCVYYETLRSKKASKMKETILVASEAMKSESQLQNLYEH